MRVAFFGSTSPTSFGTENLLWREHLKELGHEVKLYERTDPLNSAAPADLAFVHPLYSEGDLRGLAGIQSRFTVRGGKDVVNYSYIGPRGRKALASGFWDFLALPYIPETVRKDWRWPVKLISWPRGLDREITAPVSPVPHQVPRILVWADNACWERKGMDENRDVLLELQKRGYRFETIIKTRYAERALDYFRDVKNKKIAIHYTDTRTVRRIYDYCDVLLSLHRGGGQEMCPMEAIARGLVVVVPEAGCSLMYATPKNAVLVPTGQWVPKEPGWIERSTDSSDSGFGYEADVQWAVSELGGVLDQLYDRRGRALEEAPRFASRWAVSKIVRENWAGLLEEFPVLGERSREAGPALLK